MGDIGIKRARYFMKLLGNPQNKIKVIHIAGTSGKGSTAFLISHILQSQGFEVGLSISPHVFDIRERMQINNKLPDEKLVLRYFNHILPIIKEMEKSKYGSPTFFEINVGLAYYIFEKEKIDYAIMETGLGGKLDGTNTVSCKNKICIITKIGLDHTEILGSTAAQIAGEKAGIIQVQNSVISIQQSVNASKVIKEKCLEQKADLEIISKKNYHIISSSPIETVFDFNFNKGKNSFSLKKIKLGLIGKHQAENCSLALTCLFKLSRRDQFHIDEKKLRSVLRDIKIPGRMEIRKIKGQTFILDGAHNPQKMEAFTSNLSAIYPGQKFIFYIAFKKGKNYEDMLAKIIPLAEKIYLSSFSLSNQDNPHSSIDNQEISDFLLQKNFHDFETMRYPDILKNARVLSRNKKKPIIITGSFYLISKLNDE